MLVSIGMDQNGVAIRGKNIHIASANGAAYMTSRPPVRKLYRTVSESSADILSHAVMIRTMPSNRYGKDHRYCSRSNADMTRNIEMNSSTN